MGFDAEIASVRLGVTAALIEGDAASAFHLARGMLEQGVPFDVVLFDIVAGAHGDFGRRWKEGDYRIADEHAASGTVDTLVAMLAGSFDLPETGELIVAAAVEGDQHALPVRLAAAHLLAIGYRVRYLGANMEASDLGEYLAEEEPAALVLSCAMPTLLTGARASIRAAHRAGVPVLSGGYGFGSNGIWSYAVGADAWVANPREINEILSTWEPDIEVAESLVPPEPGELRLIDRSRERILAAAVSDLDDPPRRLRADLSLLLNAVEATLLVEDPALLAGFTEWLGSLLTAHGFDDSVPRDMQRALADGLRPVAPAAADLLPA